MLVKKVIEYVEKNKMLSNGDGIVVGVSGGADSVCLLKILCELRKIYEINIVAVHIHHGIRGEEADRDRDFVEKVCQSLEVENLVYKYDVLQIAKERGMTEEEAGREVRYSTFRKVMREKGFNKIAVAHNMGDNCETILFNLCRGSELKGLGGIQPVRDEIIRPLLNITRKDIEEYLNNLNIEYIVDSTNLLNEYGRNKIRNIVVPYLNENINSRTVEHIVEAGAALMEAEEYLESQTDMAMSLHKIDVKEGMIKEEVLAEPDIIVKRIIRRVVFAQAGKLKDITSTHITSVLKLFSMDVSKSINLPYDLVVKRTYEGVLINKKVDKGIVERLDFLLEAGKQYSINNEMSLMVTVKEVEKGKKLNEIKEKLYTKCFDYDKIKDTLRIRNRLPGDYLVVDSKGSHKKLKEYLINEKIPKDDREGLVLVTEGSHVLWIVGHRISEYYKVTDETTRILEIKIIKNTCDGGKDDGSQS